ncbi:MAG: bifunctional phosphopantothenoylcysteine decarboxylase/phosphopantothenate--cysteine ligase CoaBC [Bacteroidetes bacterium]|nr:MAG: bifunctional phosphopantothenoylcysteine decarboxylase/phosphopantothenate--cysteine ligase CoaBC [Bacteroidota bacterium]
MALNNKKILLGVTGSIAAYKAAFLVRLMVKSGAEVKVIMTKAAEEFIGVVTLSTLSKNPVYIDFVKPDKSGRWNNHVELGNWADLMIVAPASANTIAKMANGICDNLLLATYLSARCPVIFAPAMDLDMYSHPATAANIQKLIEHNNEMIHPGDGELASGLIGEGRMAEPEEIVEYIDRSFSGTDDLVGKSFLVTAGPTYEKIDPVRFIGNHSSGKMGFEIAESIAANGGEVTLVSGPSKLEVRHPNIKLIKVETASEMYKKCLENFGFVDGAIMTAAVADYRPSKSSDSKIKKQKQSITINLEPTQDILASLGKIKEQQFLVGFALETDNEIKNAKKKLKSKNADLIVLNSLNVEGSGFNVDTNKVWLVEKDEITEMELMPKSEVAKVIVRKIIEELI